MRIFRFESICLLSRKDQRARRINFHPRRNLLVGLNHTGKSTVVRSLMVTLGANPEGNLTQWDKDALSLVEFSVGDLRYYALHQLGYRALFNAQGQLLVATDKHRLWSDTFVGITGFNLVFNDKKGEEVKADPNCFFLPFYVNQDGSWQGGWNTFKGLQRFNSPSAAILEYFAGVRPPEFYAARAEQERENRKLEETRKEKRFLDRARERIGRTIPLDGPKIDSELFLSEIERLTDEVSQLNKQQELVRDRVVREEENMEALYLQVRLARETLNAYDKDTAFAKSNSVGDLVCPTCGAEHSHSFLDYFAYAEDARVLRELALRLESDATEAAKRVESARSDLALLSGHYEAIAETLQVRRGDLEFGQVVLSMGAERAFGAFAEEEAAMEATIRELMLAVEALDKRVRELTSRKRSREILGAFRTYYRAARVALNLPPIEMSTTRLTSRPNISGSGGPRAVLAYYAALWRLCLRGDTDFSVPVIIDSPNQQGQDEVNLPKVIRFIAQDLPSDIQMIVALETDTDYPFDNVVRLHEQYRLLREEDYQDLNALVLPFEEALFENVSIRDQATLFDDSRPNG